MNGLEGRILTLVKELEEEKRLADKRAKQLYLAGGAGTFLSLTDTPAAYAGEAGKFVKVNATPDALIFANLVAGDLPAHSHAWADVSKTGSNLTDLATRQHAGLTNITSDQHHSQSHTLASHSSKLHSELTSVTINQHHARDHEATHRSGAGDALNHDNLAGFVAAEHKSLPNTIAQVLSNHTTAVHDALSINAHRVDGYHAAEASTANTCAVRNSSGDINARLFKSEYDTTNPTCNFIMTQIDTASNNYMRPSTKAQVIASLNLMTKAGGTFSSHVYAADHPAAATDAIINVCYGTGNPPTANLTTIGTLFVKYTA